MASPAPMSNRLSSGTRRRRAPRINTIVSLNEDGVFGATGEPAARHQTVVPLLWLRILELLGRVPQGSTARFLEDGTLPG
jgi:hypothetical protein